MKLFMNSFALIFAIAFQIMRSTCEISDNNANLSQLHESQFQNHTEVTSSMQSIDDRSHKKSRQPTRNPSLKPTKSEKKPIHHKKSKRPSFRPTDIPYSSSTPSQQPSDINSFTPTEETSQKSFRPSGTNDVSPSISGTYTVSPNPTNSPSTFESKISTPKSPSTIFDSPFTAAPDFYDDTEDKKPPARNLLTDKSIMEDIVIVFVVLLVVTFTIWYCNCLMGLSYKHLRQNENQRMYAKLPVLSSSTSYQNE